VERVRPLDLIVHHSSTPERSIPAETRIHQVPPDDALMVAADDFLSPAPVLGLLFALELVPGPFVVPDTVAFPAAVTCSAISAKETVRDEPHFTPECGPDINTYTAGKWATSSWSPRTAVTC
jgi:hypothetical protein